ncbi:MAG: hypothetical protein H6567_03020 [Lewinellaceae bacterium]|nr:hypothetical protein [Lewinellaceae bacterium]
MMWYKTILFSLFYLSFFTVDAQKVTVSPDILLRNNYSYDLIPNVNGHLILYHDRGSSHVFEMYSDDLKYIQSFEPEFENKQIHTIGVTSMDTCFLFYYYYKDEGNFHVSVRKFDEHLNTLDSATLYVKTREVNEGRPRIIWSENKSKVLIFLPIEKGIHLLVYETQHFNLLQNQIVFLQEVDLKNEFKKIDISDQGDVVILAIQEASWLSKSEDALVMGFLPISGDLLEQRFYAKEDILDVLLKIDNRNKSLAIAGLLGEKDRNQAGAYYALSLGIQKLESGKTSLKSQPLPMDLVQENATRKSKKTIFVPYLASKDMVLRYDGGIILFTEITKEFIRRGTGQSFPMQNDYYSGHGYIDFYNEDVLVLANHPNGDPHWQKILYKKQFSQDDDGNYSSYFIFALPSSLKLMFNDEIKNYNTVSEYDIDPLGQILRKSLLSTEYQDLKIRFRDAIQTSENTVYIPSEKNNKVNIVKIEY